MIACLLAGIVLVLGQTSAPAHGPATALADPIIDNTHGFSIRPPRNWQFLRQRIPERRGVTLVQMVNPLPSGQLEEIVLKHSTTTQTLSMGEMLKRVAANMGLEYGDVQFLSEQEQQIAGRPGGMLAATFLREGRKRLRLQAVIESQPRNYFVLLYEGPAESQEKSEPLFNFVLDSLKLQTSRADEKLLATATHLGQVFLESIKPEALRKAIIPEQVLKFELAGSTIGYVVIRQGEESVDGHPGISVFESGWMFEADGGARRLRSSMWVSLDLTREKWQTHVSTVLPDARGRNTSFDVSTEEGKLADGILLTSQKYALNQRITENPPIKAAKSYIPRAVVRLLPALISKPEDARTLAFVGFDHARVGLVPRLIELKGSVDLPEGASGGSAFRLDDREGANTAPTSIFFNRAGLTVLVEAQGLRMSPSTTKEMEKQFAAKITEAGVLMDDLQSAAEQNKKGP